MLRKTFLMVTALLAAILLTLAACSGSGDTDEKPAGLANPASEYCQGLGFREENWENDAGQYGVCIFPDGSECDSWDFLAGRCGVERSYCVQQGFTLAGRSESNIAVCTFNDGSTCSELDYFKGDCGPGVNFP